MEASYRKDLSHTTWDEVYARQEKRAELVAFCLDELELKSGDHVLDVGSGPGYVSLQAASRVGPDGVVFAVDRSAEALDYLERHTDDPASFLRNVARCLPLGTRVVVAEFHPEGPGLQGPPTTERLAPEVVQGWCVKAGLTSLTYVRQSPECYVFVAQRT